MRPQRPCGAGWALLRRCMFFQQTLERRVAKSLDPQDLQWFRAKQLELQAILQQPKDTSLQPVPVYEGIACPDCGVYFPSVRIMRSHRARCHVGCTPKQRIGVLPAAEYVAGGVDGMPTCRWCSRNFTRVEGLKKHLKRGCDRHHNQLLQHQAPAASQGAVDEPPGQVPGVREGLLGHPCRTSQTCSCSNGCVRTDDTTCACSSTH